MNICKNITLFILLVLVLLLSACGQESPQTIEVPIIMYHDIRLEPEPGNSAIVSVEAFRTQIQALSDAGFTAVTFDDLIDFVDRGALLPENPIVITFDDGYLSNLIYAAPILEEFNMRATINVIGISRGRSLYRHTDIPIIPHFSWEQARPWVERGIIQIGHHTYDMHQWHYLPGEPWRRGVLPMEGECSLAHREALIEDFERLRRIINEELGTDVFVFAYSYGLYSEETESILQELGVRVTLTIHSGINVIEQGNPNSLFLLNRIKMTERLNIDDFFRFLEG